MQRYLTALLLGTLTAASGLASASASIRNAAAESIDERRTPQAVLHSMQPATVTANLSQENSIDPRPLYLLTENLASSERQAFPLITGVTYTADPAYQNPPDTTNRRLIDGDPKNNWNHRVGVNHADQTVTFDFQQPFDIEIVEIKFFQGNKNHPRQIQAALAETTDGPWQHEQSVEFANCNSQTCTLTWSADTVGRFLKLDFELLQWGWYVQEVRVYGRLPAAEVQAAKTDSGELLLVDEAGPRATIVVGDHPTEETREAASYLQYYLYSMTGATLPIVAEAAFDGESAALLVGPSALAQEKGVSVSQDILDDDRFVLKSGSDWVAMVGNDADELSGTAYAVFEFLQRMGAGWFAPKLAYHAVPELSLPLRISPLDFDERPVFKHRKIWTNYQTRGLEKLYAQPYLYAVKAGGREVAHGNHTLDNLVPPQEVRASHPEWYPKGAGQPDICNPEVIEYVAQKLRQRIEEAPQHRPLEIDIGQNDTDKWVRTSHTERCGRNPAAHMMYFANELAKELRSSHPERFRLTHLAYGTAHNLPNPPLEAEPEVKIFYVHQGNQARPISFPVYPNRCGDPRCEYNLIRRWTQTKALQGIWQWWIPYWNHKEWVNGLWYGGETAIANQRLWEELGVEYLWYESHYPQQRWPLNFWAQFYVGQTGAWNPSQEADAILREAMEKLFVEAAEPMFQYYKTLETGLPAMNKGRKPIINWNLPALAYSYRDDLAQLNDRLQRAEQLAQSSAVKARLVEERRLFETMQETIAEHSLR
ncbi:MAG: DUF4838 domain-containing protein [Cyanophyceae cyanobacterium]